MKQIKGDFSFFLIFFVLRKKYCCKIPSEDHYCNTQTKSVMNYLAFIKDKYYIDDILRQSIDDKTKIKIDVLAVSRYVSSRTYFEIYNEPTILISLSLRTFI